MIAEANEEAGDPRLAGAQHAATSGGEIERGFSQLADRRPQAGAGKRRLEGPQGFALRARGDLHDVGRVEAEPGQARRVKAARLAAGIRLADPEDRGRPLRFGKLRDEGQDEAARGPAIAAFAGADLMQRGERQPAAQNRIERANPKSQASSSLRPAALVLPLPYSFMRPQPCYGEAWQSFESLQRQTIRLRLAAFDPGNIPTQMAKLRLRRSFDGHDRLSGWIVHYLFL